MRRKIIIAYKYVAIAAFFIVFCHVVLLLIGCPLELAEDLVTFAPVPAVIAIGLSWVLGYCMTHRLCLAYVGIITRCIRYQQYESGFGLFLPLARYIALAMGAVVIYLLIRKKITCSYEITRKEEGN